MHFVKLKEIVIKICLALHCQPNKTSTLEKIKKRRVVRARPKKHEPSANSRSDLLCWKSVEVAFARTRSLCALVRVLFALPANTVALCEAMTHT